MSYAPIFSEPAATILKTNDRRVPDNHFPSKPSKSNGHARSRRLQPRVKAAPDNYSILVHCHLCWNWVWQRPQQFMSRLSRKHKIIFVETLAPDAELATPIARFRRPQIGRASCRER